ncbi:MAG: hypothetical protein M0Z68_08370 [Gammaproteobacteria bacterium]|nr:hypothetical protein [Gammaproteobacteria bacterium]
MRTQATSDPDCACPPWAGLTPTEARAWIDQAGGIDAAADLILSFGHSPRYQSNRDFRETHTQGPSLDVLLDLANTPGEEDKASTDIEDTETLFRVNRTNSVVTARDLDCDQWNAIRALYPHNGRDWDVLVSSARHGAEESEKIGNEVGLSGRRIRQIQDWHWDWAKANTTIEERAAHLDDPLPTARVTKRLPSRAGRKRKMSLDPDNDLAAPILILVPRVPPPPKASRRATSHRLRRRFVDPRQCDFGWGIAA